MITQKALNQEQHQDWEMVAIQFKSMEFYLRIGSESIGAAIVDRARSATPITALTVSQQYRTHSSTVIIQIGSTNSNRCEDE